MKTAGVTAFLVFLAFVLIGIGTAVAEQSTASLSIPAHHLTSKQVRLLTEAARTAQDHRELARYFHQEAQRMRAQEQYHLEMAEIYRLHPLPFDSKLPMPMQQHCKYFAAKAHEAANADEQMAAAHEQVAQQLSQTK